MFFVLTTEKALLVQYGNQQLSGCQLDISKRKEEFSLAYARAVAAVAGFATSVPTPDNDSIDLILNKKSPHEEDEEDNLIVAPQVAIQVKCTAREVIRNNALHFPLKIKNYNDLRKQKVLVPRILLVHCIPADMSDWLRHSEDDMLLRHCSYWVSLRGKPAVPNDTQVTVQVPQVNQFTPEAVSAIMERIERGEPL